MALRVLLADESPTIKKVFQLSLQDYAVDVKTVNLGVDVMAVAEQFKPDIIFADVLLQQKNGYQVSSELKAHKKLGQTPIVLMWSGFLEIDEDKYEAAQADAKLEKPFEVEKLRSLIQNLVPKTKNQNISQFLQFPNLPDLEEPSPSPEDPAVTDKAQTDSKWNMEQFEPLNISEQMPSRQTEEASDQELLADKEEEEDSEWVQSHIEHFKLNIDVDDNANAEESEVPVEDILPPLPQKKEPSRKFQENTNDDLEVEIPAEEAVAKSLDLANWPQLSEERLTELIKSQSADIIERVVWRVVPELATQIIEREIKRLLYEQSTLTP